MDGVGAGRLDALRRLALASLKPEKPFDRITRIAATAVKELELRRAPVPAPAPPGMPRATETILVAEDETAVRSVAARTLRSLGYTVLEAAHGLEAIEVARRHAGPIHLLLSDVVIPHVGGHALADDLRRERPELRVLLTSGYPADVLSGATRPGGMLLSKPYEPNGLARRVREMLDGEPTASGSSPGPLPQCIVRPVIPRGASPVPPRR